MRTPDLLSHEQLFGTGSVVLRKARRARADRLFPPLRRSKTRIAAVLGDTSRRAPPGK